MPSSPLPPFIPASVAGDELNRLHNQRVLWLEEIESAVVALRTEYPDGYLVPRHRHNRSQLLYALTGVVLVTTDAGRWMVPPEHAIWLPARVHHAVEMLGTVSMRSIYIAPHARDALPMHLHVVALTDLMRCLIVEAVTSDDDPPPGSREALVISLLLDELRNLPEQPLGLPFPADPRLSALCRRFVEKPSPHATIDEWAAALAMSRRSFTRSFQRETGLSFSLWRQQACLFAALPRLADGEPVTSVALDLGYDSVPAFTTMFKRMLGVSPRFYRSGMLAQRQAPSL
ncbi:AraC family transcriptional regulator [Phyllobacterium salinisoli]|uniref:AraC family transcriptional regulator n=1 Tax=Phyllobacterium salinisoli TaxID=1899321 RepID=A0A368K426_9HYPH|nr:helix-turn-helix transcriptional regulator [Phyllobacterium salinisoli]RCS23233.1 AraC family transcriptional regulator [Phyllobacterium salinisoli]